MASEAVPEAAFLSIENKTLIYALPIQARTHDRRDEATNSRDHHRDEAVCSLVNELGVYGRASPC